MNDEAAARRVRPPQPDDLARAGEVVARHLAPTPLLPVEPGPDLWAKLETLQPTGSFKVRGALAALAAFPAGGHAVTASAGNHGLGVAEASRRLGVRATVVVPENASPAKVQALRDRDVSLVQHGQGYDGAEAYALELAGGGAIYLSPYNDPHVIAGQATIGLELASQVAPGPLTVVCAVGGGGLCAGLALWAQSRPQTRIVGVEAAASPAVSTAVRAGKRVTVQIAPTLADGLEGNLEPGAITPWIISACGVTLLSVTEAELGAAMRWALVRWGLVLEGAAAAPLAAVLAGRVERQGTTVLILSGRNVTARTLGRVLSQNREPRIRL